MVAHRRKFPSPETRQCTSDLKRGPIEVVIRRHCNNHGFTKVVSIQGLRAQESAGRKKKSPFKVNTKNTNSKREWYDWLPIHGWSTEHVFGYIAFHFQKPFWIYKQGMKRKSCCFCIMSCQSDLKTAGKLMPQLARRYQKEERRLNFTLLMPGKDGPVFLSDIIGYTAEQLGVPTEEIKNKVKLI